MPPVLDIMRCLNPRPQNSKTMTTKGPAAYVLDIGVYSLSSTGQVLAGTTAAWCRVDDYSGDANLRFETSATPNDPRFGRFTSRSGSCYIAGHHIGDLAEHIVQDLQTGRRVALGFEAPMWFPIPHNLGSGENLFEPRFEEEADFRWYLQSGAAASIKSIALGRMLFWHIREKLGIEHPNGVKHATDLACRILPAHEWIESGDGHGEITLFEAFVAGKYKKNYRFGDIEKAHDDKKDACIGALAWIAASQGRVVAQEKQLHRAGTADAPVHSLWGQITQTAMGGPPDCDVVAL